MKASKPAPALPTAGLETPPSLDPGSCQGETASSSLAGVRAAGVTCAEKCAEGLRILALAEADGWPSERIDRVRELAKRLGALADSAEDIEEELMWMLALAEACAERGV